MTENKFARTDRVYIDESVGDIYRQLKSSASLQPDEAPFETFKDIFMFATCEGFKNNRRIELKKTGSDFRISVFSEDDIAILKAIAIAHTGDVEVLTRFGEILVIAEEYANAGIHEVKGNILDERGRPLWNLVDILSENET